MITYILIGLIILVLVESGYDKRDTGHPEYQFNAPPLNWGARIFTITIWPIVIITAIGMFIRSKNNKDIDGN